jgi:hypothetical protein
MPRRENVGTKRGRRTCTSPHEGGSESIEVRYDPSARVWLGRDDSFDLYPPYEPRGSTGYDSRSLYDTIGKIWHGTLHPEFQGDVS